MSESDNVTYNFGLRGTAGIIAGLSGTSAIIALAGSIIMLIFFLLGAPLLIPLAVALVTAILVFTPVMGRPLSEWAKVATKYATHVATTGRIEPIPAQRIGTPPETTTVPSYEIVEHGPNGFIKDDHEYINVMKLHGGIDFALASQQDQDEIVAVWGSFLASFAREGSSIQHLQIIERSVPAVNDPAIEHLTHAAVNDQSSLESYRSLLAQLGDASAVHEVYLAFRIQPHGRDVLRSCTQEVDAVVQALAQLQITCERLNKQAINDLLNYMNNPQIEMVHKLAHIAGKDIPDILPVSSREDINTYLVGGTRHRTFEITEWPRVPVLADWLHPLLVSRVAGQRILSIHIDLIPPWKAVRRAERASTNAASEMRRREQMGFEGRVRDTRAYQAIASREDELAGGYAGVKLSATLTVSAVGREALEQASRDVADAATRSRLQHRTLYGLQQAGLNASLPLCRPVPGALEHETTTRHACTLWPLQISASLGAPGVAIGWDVLSGGTFAYDPFEFYRAQLLTSPNMIVLGKVGRGKSAFVKSYLWRQSAIFGRRIWVAGDPKGEYTALARACGLDIIRLEPGGTVRLNPLDPGTETDPTDIAVRRVELLSALCAAQLGRELLPVERSALNAGVSELGREAVLADIVHLLFSPSASMASSLATDQKTLAEDARELALVLNRLLTGDLAGMFDGPSTIDISRSNGGVIDLSTVYAHHAALVPIMVCVTQWLTSQLLRSDHQTIIVLDEAWQALAAAGMADWAQATSKLARAFGVQLCIVIHRLSDLATVGDDASVATKKVKGLLQDAETVVSFAQANAELPLARDMLGLSERETELLGSLGRGRCLFLIGNHHILVDVVLTSLDLSITNTDAAM